MSTSKQPLVSVVTPVYNGATDLAQCIESVLAQTYPHWEYIIVNNHSTDGTLEIAERFARMDERIHVYSNDALLDIIANHNRAYGLISPVSAYCKVVSADDWLFPECLARMVGLAEASPSVGMRKRIRAHAADVSERRIMASCIRCSLMSASMIAG